VNLWFPRVTAHSLAIVLSLLTYVITTRAERERRPPSIAIAWVLGLLALPYLALPAYLLFGRRKLPRRISPWSGHRLRGRHWAEDLIESFGLAAAVPCRVRMHADGAQARAALIETLERARVRLDVCTYILGADPFGEEMMARLAACRARGVRVRFLIDGVGALTLPRHCLKRLHAAGIETAVFSPLLARHTQGPRNLRNHRKWVVADDAVMWAGGRNLAAEYFCGAPGITPWLDLSFDLVGPVAAAAARQFEADWEAAGGAPGKPLPAPPDSTPLDATPLDATPADATPASSPSSERGQLAQFLPSGPDQPEDTVHALLVDACYHARERILAVTPYFVPDATLETAMRLAARRGVRIDLYIPRVSNHRLADFARNRSLRALCEAGASIHLSRTMNHAKAVLFDRDLALCGSPNLDSRSLLLNYESAVIFYGEPEIQWLEQWIQALLPQTERFEHRSPGLMRDLAEGLLLTIGYQL
jgi:cardiolipin synthase